jgi:hypothetical protein
MEVWIEIFLDSGERINSSIRLAPREGQEGENWGIDWNCKAELISLCVCVFVCARVGVQIVIDPATSRFYILSRCHWH